MQKVFFPATTTVCLTDLPPLLSYSWYSLPTWNVLVHSPTSASAWSKTLNHCICLMLTEHSPLFADAFIWDVLTPAGTHHPILLLLSPRNCSFLNFYVMRNFCLSSRTLGLFLWIHVSDWKECPVDVPSKWHEMPMWLSYHSSPMVWRGGCWKGLSGEDGIDQNRNMFLVSRIFPSLPAWFLIVFSPVTSLLFSRQFIFHLPSQAYGATFERFYQLFIWCPSPVLCMAYLD